MHYINLGILLVLVGLVIGVYVHTDKKIDKLSDKMDRLSNRMDENNKALTDRMDRLYDILVHMGFRDKEYRDKAANE
ncbi:MAG: hypothetical protein ACYCTB_03415 [bacterium]